MRSRGRRGSLGRERARRLWGRIAAAARERRDAAMGRVLEVLEGSGRDGGGKGRGRGRGCAAVVVVVEVESLSIRAQPNETSVSL
jgi:uncharacterized Ntn-hydrolase superfamily protein